MMPSDIMMLQTRARYYSGSAAFYAAVILRFAATAAKFSLRHA